MTLFDAITPPTEPDEPPPAVKPDTTAMHGMLRQRYSATNPGNGPRYVVAPEVRNQAGFGGYGGDGRLRSCDLMVMDTWQSGPVRLIGHEIKVSRSDWLRELKDPDKAAAFIPHVAEWWLAVADRKIVCDGELPEGWGLLAPAGSTLRAVVKADRKPQPEIPTGMLAALLRSVQGIGRAEVDRARQPRPATLDHLPMCYVRDDLPRVDGGWQYKTGTEIQRPDYNLRRRSA